MANDGNRGRSDEARDPNREIDPETGEKVGLGPRDGGTDEPENPDPVEVNVDTDADDGSAESSEA